VTAREQARLLHVPRKTTIREGTAGRTFAEFDLSANNRRCVRRSAFGVLRVLASRGASCRDWRVASIKQTK
jgi:hypothetical protein